MAQSGVIYEKKMWPSLNIFHFARDLIFQTSYLRNVLEMQQRLKLMFCEMEFYLAHHIFMRN